MEYIKGYLVIYIKYVKIMNEGYILVNVSFL